MPTTVEATCGWKDEATLPEIWVRPTKEDRELKTEIEQARTKLLALGHDWDGEDSAAYSKDTLDRAVSFLTTHSIKGYDLCSLYPPAPRIGPGPEGSIDLHWKEKTWELLVNIPADNSQMAVFYGDDYGALKIKGSFDPRTVNLGIVAWLMH
jgi:hypothetical protein